jgi:hypothetical protein
MCNIKFPLNKHKKKKNEKNKENGNETEYLTISLKNRQIASVLNNKR